MPRASIGPPLAACTGILVLVFAVPLAWPSVYRAWAPNASRLAESYLPALESRRARNNFDVQVVQDLHDMQPGLVVIGDSMAGRIEEGRLSETSGLSVAPLVMPASGPAYWYLAFKNWVLASGVRPQWVVVFFRDTNLTDTLFRIDGPYRDKLDAVALDREPELDALVAARVRTLGRVVDRAVDAAYLTTETRAWMEPAVNVWLASRVVAPTRAHVFLGRVNEAFGFDKLRPLDTADVAIEDDPVPPFATDVTSSVLPLWLRAAQEARVRVAFVRVLRRAVDGRPRAESAPLQAYVRDLRAFITDRGGLFLDDRDVAELSRLPYADGDHVAPEARGPYSDRLWSRLREASR